MKIELPCGFIKGVFLSIWQVLPGNWTIAGALSFCRVYVVTPFHCVKRDSKLHSLSALVNKKTRLHISVDPFPYKKDGLPFKDHWGLSEKNAGTWQRNRFLQNDPFLGRRVQACKQGSYSEWLKWKKMAKNTSLQNRGCCKKLVDVPNHMFFCRPRGL